MTSEDRDCMLSYVKILHDRGLQGGCNVALIKNTNKIQIAKTEIVEMLIFPLYILRRRKWQPTPVLLP